MSQLQVTGEAKIRDIQGPVVANDGVVTALDGAASQYVRGDGTLADFPTSSGGGSSVSYYLNSSVSQGTIGGVAYRELSKDPIIGAGTDIAISANGYVANYITDVNDPDVVLVPGGNFNCEFYFSVSNETGNPTTYAELYKYDGTTFTLLGTSAGVPESINQGTTIAPYYFAIPVATAALSVTDRLAIRIYVNVDGRTVTLHTENGHLCQVVTTLSKGMVSLNNLTDQSQYLATGTSGTDFNIVSSGDTHTFNIPSASASNRGLITTGSQTIAGAKTFSNNVNINSQLFIFGGTGYGGGISYRQGGILSTSDGSTTTEFPDANSIKYYVGQGSNTYKNFIFDVNNITLNATRTYNLPDLSGTLALLEADNMFTQVNMFDQSVNFKANGSLVGTSGYISQAYAKTGSGAGSTLSLKIQDGNSLKAINLDFVGSPATYTYTYPAFTGTLALLEGTQTFSGDKIFNGALDFNNSININSGIFIRNNAVGSTLYTNFSITKASNIQTLSYLFSTGFASNLLFNDAATYSYSFPTASGTIALTSNLSSYVPYTGATANVDLGVRALLAQNIVVGQTSTQGYIHFKTGGSTAISADTCQAPYGTNGMIYSFDQTGGNYKQFVIDSSSLTNNTIRTYTMPNASGTLALTSNLSAYLPLTGGTLTGALTGTSATFSGGVTSNATTSVSFYSGTYVSNSLGDGSFATYSGRIRENASYALNIDLYDRTAATWRTPLSFNNTGGAATFSSSVTAGTQFIGSNTNTDPSSGTTTASVLALNGQSAANNFGIGVGAIRNSAYDMWFQTGSSNGGGYRWYIGTSEKLTMSSTGLVGIGTSSPTEILHLNSSNTAAFIRFQNTGGSGTYLGSRNDNMEIYTGGSERMRITSGGDVGIGNTAFSSTRLTTTGKDNTSSNYSFVANNSSNSNLFLVRNDGNVLIPGNLECGTTGLNGRIGIYYGLTSKVGIDMRDSDDASNAYFLFFRNSAGTGIGSIQRAGLTNAILYNTTSDYRLKEDFKEINGLDKLAAIKVYDFKWKGLEDRMDGVIAHELQEIMPYAVSGQKDGENMQAVDYSKIVPTLIKAIQEQQAQIEELKALIATK
jgi:hypothetical protein